MQKLVITTMTSVLALGVWTPIANASPARAGPHCQGQLRRSGFGHREQSEPQPRVGRDQEPGIPRPAAEGLDPPGHRRSRLPLPTVHAAAGRTVKVHTGSGHRTARHLYWGSGAYIWNNDGDRATLRNRDRRLIDRCSWGDGGGVKVC